MSPTFNYAKKNEMGNHNKISFETKAKEALLCPKARKVFC